MAQKYKQRKNNVRNNEYNMEIDRKHKENLKS